MECGNVLTGNVMQIPLTQGKQALVSELDYEKASKHKWCAHFNGRGTYYAVGLVNGKMTKLHRFISGITNKPDLVVDQKDGDGLNNTRENLRVCSKQENSWNRANQKNSTTSFKGVTFTRGRYVSRINFKGKRIHLGYYATTEEASASYNNAAIKFHGEYSQLNNNFHGIR